MLEEIVFRPGALLNLWHDSRGHLVGFTTNCHEPVEIGARRVRVLNSGAYFFPGHRAGWRLVLRRFG